MPVETPVGGQCVEEQCAGPFLLWQGVFRAGYDVGGVRTEQPPGALAALGQISASALRQRTAYVVVAQCLAGLHVAVGYRCHRPCAATLAATLVTRIQSGGAYRPDPVAPMASARGVGMPPTE